MKLTTSRRLTSPCRTSSGSRGSDGQAKASNGRLRRWPWLCVLPLSALVVAGVQARTIYRCVRDGSVSLASAPEPGSRCTANEVDDNAAKLPNLWGAVGVVDGALYERQQEGKTVYSTRNLPGSVRVLGFTLQTPAAPVAAENPATFSTTPRLDRYPAQFAAAARATGVEDAWLRAIAHAESGFDPRARSAKGAVGVMQLMPRTATELGVRDPLSPGQSIDGGARYLKTLLRLYRGDHALAAAAYNAGIGAVARHGGVPPYPETLAYVARVAALHARYRLALGTGSRPELAAP